MGNENYHDELLAASIALLDEIESGRDPAGKSSSDDDNHWLREPLRGDTLAAFRAAIAKATGK